MSNEIRRNPNNYINMHNINNKAIYNAPVSHKINEATVGETNRNSMEYLDLLGHAQVNMSKSQNEVVRNYMKDPIKADLHTDFCDKLMKERGCSLEQAVAITDKVFETLEQKDTYK